MGVGLDDVVIEVAWLVLTWLGIAMWKVVVVLDDGGGGGNEVGWWWWWWWERNN